MKTEGELHVSDTVTPADWPAEGRVSYNKMRMRYREGMPLALRGVTFTVEPREKIGIVGRSGSGGSPFWQGGIWPSG